MSTKNSVKNGVAVPPLPSEYIAKVAKMRVKPEEYVAVKVHHPTFAPDHGTRASISAAVRTVMRRQQANAS